LLVVSEAEPNPTTIDWKESAGAEFDLNKEKWASQGLSHEHDTFLLLRCPSEDDPRRAIAGTAESSGFKSASSLA
jgi:hypothetical protein